MDGLNSRREVTNVRIGEWKSGGEEPSWNAAQEGRTMKRLKERKRTEH